MNSLRSRTGLTATLVPGALASRMLLRVAGAASPAFERSFPEPACSETLARVSAHASPFER